MHRHAHWPLLALIAACGSDGSGASNIPADATALDSYIKTGVNLLLPQLGYVDASLPFLLNPASPGASGLSFTPDPDPGAAPNSYLFAIPVDRDGDGIDELTLSGHATLTGDPASAGVGFGGHVDLTATAAAGLGDFAGTLDFAITAEGGQVSGSGTVTDALNGRTTTLTVNSAAPIHLKPATGTANSMGNACGYSLQGDVGLEVTGANGALSSIWNFLSNRQSVSVTSASYTDNDGKTTDLPDRNVVIPCGGGAVADWVGTYEQQWSCLPPEYGTATLTLSGAGGTTISISDQDPPVTGDIDTYQATALPGTPHVLRGYFIGGPVGNTYREDFTWTLADNKASMSETSRYTYIEGPGVGTGGLCAGRATRLP